jgi:hypothetical protein
VPEALRKAALRKLWTTDPEISGFIEMADYQWDFNNPDSIPGWSSSLKAEDATRLLGRMFGLDDAKDEPVPAKSEGGDETADPPAVSAALEKDPADLPPPVFAAKEAPEPANDEPVHVASQNKQAESVICRQSRKRHGGALPT